MSDLPPNPDPGGCDALDRAFPLVYEDLRHLARRHLRREAAGHTLSTTALVHEAYVRLERANPPWGDRAHFFALAATAMRRILVDHARRHHAARRGGAPSRVPLEAIEGMAVEERADLLVALDDALARLARLDPRQVRVVECRFFGGLTEEETAQALGVGLRTAKRDWAKARSWLYGELFPGTPR
ncbi:MAG: hypothetical protein AVDCRST_MAG89-3342 [uncultured Gemmatimonadetes bacterium]|uniref:RNA polymerase sigma-70 ECF-like HTH domain-containing protein n=1 Tax=uncultured Gemmatimonadota bacterium TaxID=203437 RepID=A0A6J4MCG5_9BACT|nr:MAG: hypothetical protein AVDCRST_MAG89-3342 [uncultured Gemmatimonadota bacterium]